VPQKSAESARGRARFDQQLPSRLTFAARDFGATFAFFEIVKLTQKSQKRRTLTELRTAVLA
jgi:hypothetical protein